MQRRYNCTKKEWFCSVFPSFWCAACQRGSVRHPQRSRKLLERVISISFKLASPPESSPPYAVLRLIRTGDGCGKSAWCVQVPVLWHAEIWHIWKAQKNNKTPSRGLCSAVGMQPSAGEGNVYQKQYSTLSWRINSYKLTPAPPTPPPQVALQAVRKKKERQMLSF